MKKVICKHLEKRKGNFYTDYKCKLLPKDCYHRKPKDACRKCPKVLELFDNI